MAFPPAGIDAGELCDMVNSPAFAPPMVCWVMDSEAVPVFETPTDNSFEPFIVMDPKSSCVVLRVSFGPETAPAKPLNCTVHVGRNGSLDAQVNAPP